MSLQELEAERLLATVELTRTSQIRSRLYEFNGVTRADVRLWAFSKKAGDWIPTRKGVSVPEAQIPELLEAVQALIEADEEGL